MHLCYVIFNRFGLKQRETKQYEQNTILIAEGLHKSFPELRTATAENLQMVLNKLNIFYSCAEEIPLVSKCMMAVLQKSIIQASKELIAISTKHFMMMVLILKDSSPSVILLHP